MPCVWVCGWCGRAGQLTHPHSSLPPLLLLLFSGGDVDGDESYTPDSLTPASNNGSAPTTPVLGAAAGTRRRTSAAAQSATASTRKNREAGEESDDSADEAGRCACENCRLSMCGGGDVGQTLI